MPSAEWWAEAEFGPGLDQDVVADVGASVGHRVRDRRWSSSSLIPGSVRSLGQVDPGGYELAGAGDSLLLVGTLDQPQRAQGVAGRPGEGPGARAGARSSGREVVVDQARGLRGKRVEAAESVGTAAAGPCLSAQLTTASNPVAATNSAVSKSGRIITAESGRDQERRQPVDRQGLVAEQVPEIGDRARDNQNVDTPLGQRAWNAGTRLAFRSRPSSLEWKSSHKRVSLSSVWLQAAFRLDPGGRTPMNPAIVDAHNDLLLELDHRRGEPAPFARYWLPLLDRGGVASRSARCSAPSPSGCLSWRSATHDPDRRLPRALAENPTGVEICAAGDLDGCEGGDETGSA